MGKSPRHTSKFIALLIAGSAMLLLSCGDKKITAEVNTEMLVTQRSDSLVQIKSHNGVKQYYFKTPLLERYELASEPYMEFKKGVWVETYKDSTGVRESMLEADYAINYEKRQLWEARGNVVAVGANGQTLYTEQLFWDQRMERIYSNVDSKIVQGDEVFVGEGFESDDKLEKWVFRNYTGQVALDVDSSDNETSESKSQSDGVEGDIKTETETGAGVEAETVVEEDDAERVKNPRSREDGSARLDAEQPKNNTKERAAKANADKRSNGSVGTQTDKGGVEAKSDSKPVANSRARLSASFLDVPEFDGETAGVARSGMNVANADTDADFQPDAGAGVAAGADSGIDGRGADTGTK